MQGVSSVILPEGVSFDGATIVPILTDIGPRLIQTRTPPVSIVELGKKLLNAAKNGETEEVRDLMAKGAPFTTDWLGTSPLHFAAANNHLETCEVLLRAGISRDARTKVDRTPLHMAAYEGHAAVCETLILNGADIEARDMLKMSALHWAVQNEHPGVAALLLKHGANPDVINKFDKSPVDIAVDLNRMDIVQQLQFLHGDPLGTMESDLQITLDSEEERPMEKEQLQQNEEVVNIEESMPIPEPPEPPNEDIHITINNCKTTENVIEDQETIDIADSMEILKEHGISFLPNDESSVVANAVEHGRSLAFTEVGKQVFNSTKPYIKIPVQKAPMTAKLKARKVVTVTPDQLLQLVGQKNGIFKKLPNIVNLSEKPIKKNVVMNKNKIIVSNFNVTKKKPDYNLANDYDMIRRQLAEARQQAEEYKQMLKRKEAEAERYKRQLQSITQGK